MAVVSIIQKSQLEGAKRLDAEYYCSPRLLGGDDFYTGAEVVSFVQYGTSEELNEDGIGYPVLRLNEFEEYFSGIPAKSCDKLSKAQFEELRLKRGDVLITRTNGNPALVGKAAMVMKNSDVAFASYLFRVRPEKTKINSATLVTFLDSKFGRSEIEKYLMPSIQSNFSPAKFREIKIPKFSDTFQHKIELLFDSSYSELQESKSLYSQAEELLLKKLGLADFEEEAKLWSVVKLSEAQEAGRIDAEYFQPKYEKLESRIREYGAKYLAEMIDNVSAKFNPALEPNKVFKYVELSNINASIGTIDGYSETSGKEAPSRAKRVLKTNDVIVSSVEGSLGKVALVDKLQVGYLAKLQVGYLASTGFFQFRSKSILPEVLLVLFKSTVLRYQFEQRCAGTILTAVPKESIKDILVPVLPDKTQQKIAGLVRQSHEARAKAKQLLEDAKRRVEELIESVSTTR